MTAPTLLFYITAALLLQVIVGIAVALARRGGVAGDSAATPTVAPRREPPALREFRVIRREYADPAGTQCSFHLEPVDGQPLSPFQAGQFLTFSLSPPNAAGASTPITRCYSLSDTHDPSAYRITVKRVPNGQSSGYLHDRIKAGDLLWARGPAGHFTLDPDTATPVVLIAGGIGITPLFAMLRALLSQPSDRAVHLYYGIRTASEAAFRMDLEALRAAHSNLSLNWVYSRLDSAEGTDPVGVHRGRIDVALLKRTLPHGLHHFYVCGPASMLNDLVPALREWGVPSSHVHYEAFGPSTVNLNPNADAPAEGVATTAVDVEFRSSGRSLSWDGRDANLLEFAERNAVVVPSGCRSGSCGSCETKLLSGEVRYAATPDHDIAPGHCLLCVGRPVTSVALEA